MWKENAIIVNKDGAAVHIGTCALEYVNLQSPRPFAYPQGKSEKGDLLIYFAKNTAARKEEIQILIERGFCTEDVLQTENLILVAAEDNWDVKPLIKRNLPVNYEPETWLDTIFERNEIIVRTDGTSLMIDVNGQIVSWNLDWLESAAVAVKDQSLKFFRGEGTDSPAQLAESLRNQKYPPYCDREYVYGKPLQEILHKKIYEVVSQMAEDGEVYLSNGGKSVLVRREHISAGDDIFRAYIFENADSLMRDLSQKSQKYKRLHTEAGKQLNGQPQLNSFRLWGDEDKIREVSKLLQKCSATNTTILLTGESGTGKTFLAHEIHKNSKRSQKPFVHVNCAAIPYQLIESELFGYEEGAFTGARKGGKKGFFEMANGGTLFLDEITEIPITLQGKLLEVLQNKTYYQVGGMKKLESDVRLIAATNRNLKVLVREKRFREDLYYRINVFPIEIPPLRERIHSLYSIIMDILPDICSRLEIEPILVSSQAFEKMVQYPWPGNIRELENVLEKAAILSDGKIILPEDIMLSEAERFITSAVTLQEVRERAEREAIVNALQMFHGDKIKAARYLDVGRSNMFEKVKKYRIHQEEVENDDFR